MRKIFTFIVLSFTALSAIPFVPVVKAQNITCADRPAGDKTNACANTRFVMSNGGGGGATPGGLSGQVQYNNSGTFGGLTNTQLTALVNNATASTSGSVPAFPNNTTTFYRGDGTYSVPSTVSTSNPGYAPAFPNNTTTSLLGNGTWGSAISNNYTSGYTGGVAYAMQQRLDAGPLLASDFGVTCDGTTNDATNMDKFLAAVAVSRSKIGIVTGTSTASICNMGANQFLIRPGTTIECSRGVTLKFSLANSLVTPFGAHSGRTYQGIFEGCTIDGSSTIGSTGVDLFDASDWVVRDTIIGNVDTGLALQGNTASYYNRILNVVAHDIRLNGYYLDPNANSNTLTGVRTTSIGQYGIYCRGNQNTFTGVQVETGFVEAFTTDGNCIGTAINGIRMEGGTNGIHFVSGANYNTVTGAYCQALTGSSYINSGTGNVKTGGNC